MARPLPILPMHKLRYSIPSSFTFVVVLAVILSVISVVTFLCGSLHKEKKKKKKTVKKLGGHEKSKSPVKKAETRFNNKALLIVSDEGEDGDAVWKKAIIKGDKCRPLDFSGRILYDSNGNLLHE